MKKVVYFLTLAVAMSLAACNSENGASSKSSDGEMIVTETSAASVGEVATSAQNGEMATPEAAAQPSNGSASANAAPQQPPKATPFSAEDAVKYKEGIKLVKEYSDELNKCVDAKMNGGAIDEATKQRITEIQNKLTELEKAGKMNKQLVELKKVSDDVYKKVLAK